MKTIFGFISCNGKSKVILKPQTRPNTRQIIFNLLIFVNVITQDLFIIQNLKYNLSSNLTLSIQNVQYQYVS